MPLILLLLTLMGRPNIPATFEGLLPTGIRQTLTLRNDGTFILRSTDKAYVNTYETGRYSFSGSKLTLGKKPDAKYFLLLPHGDLKTLDAKGKETGSSLDIMSTVDPIYMLEGTAWKLTQLQNRSVSGRAELTFKEMKVTGSSGCNRMFGSYTIDGSKLTLAGIGGTKMACDGPIMEQENALLKALEKVDSYRITRDTLELLHGPDQIAALSAR